MYRVVIGKWMIMRRSWVQVQEKEKDWDEALLQHVLVLQRNGLLCAL